MISKPVFVDASAWVALIDAGDRLHGRARSFWRTAQNDRRKFLTSNYVLDETYTLLRRRRVGLAMASAAHDLIESSQLIEVADIGEDLRRHAWELFVGYADKILSFTDCTSFALMHERELLEVFTFDADFQRAGFIVCPP